MDTVNRLAHDCVNIVGIKEAGGNPDRVSQIARGAGSEFYDSERRRFADAAVHGRGRAGVISVASNIIPREVSHMVKAFAMGKPAVALETHDKYYPIVQGFVHRNQSAAGQSRAGDDGDDRRGISSAAGADERRKPGSVESDVEGVRRFEIIAN